jgi:integrase
MAKSRRQRGSVVQKGNSWFGYFRDKSGKKKWIGEKPGQGFKTYSAARRRLNEIITEVDAGSYVPPKAGTFSAFAVEWEKSRLSIQGSTLSAYRSMIRCHLVPAFGEMNVAEIELAHVQDLATKLAKTVGSPKTLHNVMTLLQTMLAGKKGSSAIRSGYIRYNPAQGVELPPKETEEVVPPTVDQVSRLLEAAREIGGIGYPTILLAAFAGVRRGEVLALNYTDVDWFSRELVIRQAVKKQEATDGVHKWRWVLDVPKSKKSRRRIGLTSTLIQLLTGFKEVHGGKGLIFPKGLAGLAPTDQHLDPDYFDQSIIAPIATVAGMPGMRYHDLRHFFASVLIGQGANAKYVCDQMGHSSVEMTFDTYGHLFPKARQEETNKLDAFMTSALSTKSLGSEKGSNVDSKSTSENVLVERLVETGRSHGSKSDSKRRLN